MSVGEETFALHLRGVDMRECGHCKKQFVPKRVGGRHKGIFCSRDCSFASRARFDVCEICQKTFVASKTQNKYCSKDCSSAAMKGERNHAWAGGIKQRKCKSCGKEFSVFPGSTKQCCSRKCGDEALNRLGESNSNWRGGKKAVKCKNCGAQFEVPQSADRSYCSKTCFVQSSFSRSAPRWSSKSKWGMTASKSGKRPDLGIYVRSACEANYARYLNFLKDAKQIQGWEYEAETFEFPVKRGTRFYTPDFKVTNTDGSVEYHELKGYMYAKGKTALARMGRHHPKVKIVLIQKSEYEAIRRQFRNSIPNWEGR